MSDSDLEAYFNECKEGTDSSEDGVAGDWHSGPAVSPVRGGSRSMTPQRLKRFKGQAERTFQRSAFAAGVAAQLMSRGKRAAQVVSEPLKLSQALQHRYDMEDNARRVVLSIRNACSLYFPDPGWDSVRGSINQLVEDLEAAPIAPQSARARIELGERLRWVCELYSASEHPVDMLLKRCLRAESDCDWDSFGTFASFFLIALFPHLHSAFGGNIQSLPSFLRDVSVRSSAVPELSVTDIQSLVLGVLSSWCCQTTLFADLTVPTIDEARVLRVTPRSLSVQLTNMLGVKLLAPFQPQSRVYIDQREGLFMWLKRTVLGPIRDVVTRLNREAVIAVHNDNEGSARIFSLLEDVVMFGDMSAFVDRFQADPLFLERASIKEMVGEGATANLALSALFAEGVGGRSSLIQLAVLPSPQASSLVSAKVTGLLRAIRLSMTLSPREKLLLGEVTRGDEGWRQMTSCDPYSALFSTLFALSIISTQANALWKRELRGTMGVLQHSLCCVRHLERVCSEYVKSQCRRAFQQYVNATLRASCVDQIERAAITFGSDLRRVIFHQDTVRLSDAFEALIACMLRSVLDGNSTGLDEVVTEFISEAEAQMEIPGVRHLLNQVTFNHYYST